MKKFITAILLIMYSLSVSGAAVHMHYCMNELASMGISLNGSKKQFCEYCGMDEQSKTDCCEETVQKINIDKEQQKQAFSFTLNFPAIKETHNNTVLLFTSLPSKEAETYPVSTSPPAIAAAELNIFYCTFLI